MKYGETAILTVLSDIDAWYQYLGQRGSVTHIMKFIALS